MITKNALIWQKILLFLCQSSSDIHTVSQLSHFFKKLVFKGPVFASRLITRYGSLLAFISAYDKHPKFLTPEVIEALVQQGAILPKFWIETVFRNQAQDPSRLPDGSLELIVSQGFKLYDDELRLTVPFINPQDDVNPDAMDQVDQVEYNPYDDSLLFYEAMAHENIDLDKLELVLKKHQYLPLLSPPHSESQNIELFKNILRVSLKDPDLAYYIAKASTTRVDKSNLQVLFMALDDEKIHESHLDSLLKSGFDLNPATVIWFFCHCSLQDPKSRMEWIQSKLSSMDLEFCIEKSLSDLFESSSPLGMIRADYILNTLDVSEDIVSSALLVSHADASRTKMRTKCGYIYNGMKDNLWQLILSRYQVSHPLVIACLSDLIIGGSLPSVTDESKKGSILFKGESEESQIKKLSLLQIETEDKEEKELRSRDSLSVLLQSGVPLIPETFAVISQIILETKVIENRYLDYMVKVEKMLSKILCQTISNKSIHSLFEKEKVILFEWLAAFHAHVLNSNEWNSALNLKKRSYALDAPHSPTDTPRQSMMSRLGSVVSDLIPYTNPDLKRFYDCIKILVDQIESVCATPPPNDEDSHSNYQEIIKMESIEATPFNDFLTLKENSNSPSTWLDFIRSPVT